MNILEHTHIQVPLGWGAAMLLLRSLTKQVEEEHGCQEVWRADKILFKDREKLKNGLDF